MRALVTGFEPFDGDDLNASREALRRLPARIGMIDVTTAMLPTSFARAHGALQNAIAHAQPELVLCVGEAGDRAELCVEHAALNVQDARIPDNDGMQPAGTAVVAGAPPAYVATLPVRACVVALRAAGLPAAVSYSAGTYVCNHVFFALMHLAETGDLRLRGGFLHVPRLPQQAARRGGGPSMPLEDIVRGIVTVLEAAAAYPGPNHETSIATESSPSTGKR